MASIPDAGIYGDNVSITLFVDGVPQPGTEYATAVKIKQENTIHKRNHLGRKRQRITKQVNGYTITFAMDLATTKLLDKFRERDDARDANRAVPELNLMVNFDLRDGTSVAYMATGCEETTDVDSPDREQEVVYNVEISAEDFTKVA